jgi:acyl-CoA synthetase (AMP-forming)/AMP-acid ligase II
VFSSFRTERAAELSDRLERTVLPNSVYDLLVETAREHGDKPAWHFIDADITRTWQDVVESVDLAAGAFTVLGIGKDAHVAVMCRNREEFPISWLALSRLQAAMVPINPSYSLSELNYALTTSNAAFLMIEAGLLDQLEQDNASVIENPKVIIIDADTSDRGIAWTDALANARDAHVPEVSRHRDQLLNLQFTSGTTGFPKACMLTNDYWFVLGLSCNAVFSVDLSRYYLGTSFFYMLGFRILMNALFSGGCIYVADRPGAKRYIRDLVRFQCDYAAFTELIYKQPKSADDRKNNLKLASVFALSPRNHADFQGRFDVYAQELYGMTEIGLGTYIPAQDLERMTGSGRCGVAAPLRMLMIADAEGKPTPRGEVGELCVRGRGVMTGYYRNEDANVAAYHGDWFRTGDLARLDAQGFYSIVGRTKDMIRRSGENISAREVESVLRSMPEITEAAVLAVPDDYYGEEVKAYVMLEPGLTTQDVPPSKVLAHCSEHLATFKRPRYIEYREAFPLTTESHRVQKKVLLEEKPDLRSGSYDSRKQAWI